MLGARAELLAVLAKMDDQLAALDGAGYTCVTSLCFAVCWSGLLAGILGLCFRGALLRVVTKFNATALIAVAVATSGGEMVNLRPNNE